MNSFQSATFSVLAICLSVLGAEAGFYEIDLPGGAKPHEITAGKELDAYLSKIASGSVSVEGCSPAVFHVGDTAFAVSNGLGSVGMEDEAWVIKSFGGDVVLNGGGPRGALYAVAHFLEDRCGVRWWSELEERVPGPTPLKFGKLDDRGRPAFRVREISPTKNGVESSIRHSVLNRLNCRPWGCTVEQRARWGCGRLDVGSPGMCHTFGLHIPAEKYGRDHPEWFAYSTNAAKRILNSHYAQLCLSNPEVLEKMTDSVLASVSADGTRARREGVPPPFVYDVSQNDGEQFCECANCLAVRRRKGDSGYVLDFVNALAVRVGKIHPGILIRTFAYLNTETPPLSPVAPAENVIIRLCDTKSNMAAPYHSEENRYFRTLVEAWGRLARRLEVWDYSITYTTGLTGLPFASESFYADALRHSLSNSVERYFYEHEAPHMADMWELKRFVEAKLLENPMLDNAALVDTFCSEYYGAAAPMILAYRRGLKRAREMRGGRIEWFPQSIRDWDFIHDDDVEVWQSLFDRAEKAVGKDGALFARVRQARQSLDRLVSLRHMKLGVGGAGLDVKAARARLQDTWRSRLERHRDLSPNAVRDLLETACGTPVPPQFSGRKIQVFTSSFLRGNKNIIAQVDDPESFFGRAKRLDATGGGNYALPFACGLFDCAARKTLCERSFPAVDWKGYKWIKIGTATIPRTSYIWFTRAWNLQLDLKRSSELAGRTFDIWASVKFTGPLFQGGGEGPSFVWVDGVVLEEESCRRESTKLSVQAGWDDALSDFRRKAGVSGGDVWAGIARHPAVVNPPVRAEGTKFISLAGEWELVKRPHGAVAGRSLQEIQYGIRWGGQRNKWYASSGTDTVHRVTVPGCWEASGVGEPGKGVPHLCTDSIEQELRHFYAGACWYRKDVAIPADWKGQRLWLKVGGIRSRGWCYVNGRAVALFDAGVGAWKWEITDFAKPGETALVMICADNAVAARGGIANSKNRWGGLVRDIEIEATPAVFIDDAWVRGDFDRREAVAHITVGRAASQGRAACPQAAERRVEDNAPYQIRVAVEDKTMTVELPRDQSSFNSQLSTLHVQLAVPLRNFRPWSPAHPNLYTARVDLVTEDGKVLHSRLERFGVRKLEVRGKDFYLNDKPFYIRGCGDNSVYPATGVSPADRAFHLAHLKMLKAAGFNYVRMHTHYEQPEYFDAADEAGVLLAPELAYYADEPNDHFDYDPLRDAYDAFVALRRNVSYAVRGVGNEGTLGPEAGRLLYRFHKELDPGSLAIEQDGGSYLRPDWGRGTSDFANGPLTSWRRGAINPPVPLVAHEYLNLAAKADCRDESKWSDVLAPPMTRSQRRAHLAHTGLSDGWLDRLQDAQHALQKYWQKNGIEAARADPFCDGYVFWTIVDSTVFNKASGVYTAQGMFTPFWQPKRCGTTVAAAAVYNSPSCLLIDNDGPADRRGDPYPDGLVYCSSRVGVREATNRVYAAGDEIPLDIMLSHYDEDLEINAGVLTWRFVTPEGATLVTGEKSVGAQPRGPMRILARLRVRVPSVKKPVKAMLQVSLAGLANSWDFWFFPKAETPDDPESVVVADYGSKEADAVRRAGKNLLVVGNRSDKANFTMGWWWLGKQVGTAVKPHACLGDFPYEPFLSPLLFRLIKEGESLPVVGYAEEDYVIVGEGLKDAYLYLAAKVRADGGREVYVSGLDISGTTPESASLRANLMRWLAHGERHAAVVSR